MIMARSKESASAKREVVVITSASAGIGRATARKFAKHGARIALIARGETGLLATQSEVEEEGGEAIIIPIDVADADSVERAAEIAENRFGEIDIWINNAATSMFAPVWETRPEEFRRIVEVNYFGYVYGTLAALKRMRPRGRGTIIQVGSIPGFRSIPFRSAYSASKHAIAGFTDGLRSELIHENSPIRVTIVHLSSMNMPQFSWVFNRLKKKVQPFQPIFQLELAARGIYHAAHHDRREWFIGEPALKAMIGQKLLPGFMDHFLAKNGYKSQQTDDPQAENQPHNLWDPVDEDRGAHGSFDSIAANDSLLFRLSRHRKEIALLSAGLITAAGAMLLAKSRKRRPSKDFSSFASGVPTHPHQTGKVRRVH